MYTESIQHDNADTKQNQQMTETSKPQPCYSKDNIKAMVMAEVSTESWSRIHNIQCQSKFANSSQSRCQ